MFVPVPAPEEMARWDAAATAAGISEETLMENAARAAADSLRRHASERGLSLADATVLLLAGGGNNGGDAFCLARHLLDAGARPVVLRTRRPEEYRGAAGHWLHVAVALGVPVFSSDAWESGEADIPDVPDIVVDGLLGTGFHGELREREARLVKKLNGLRARLVLALDIPSGLSARTGRPSPDAVRAHVTVTFQAAKPGLLLAEASAFTGVLEVRPIGMPRAVQEQHPPSFRTWLPFRQTLDRGAPYALEHEASPHVLQLLGSPRNEAAQGPAHKGAAGRVLVIGGCPAYTGAPCLAAWAALRAGAGLVMLAGPEEVLNAARLSMPALTLHALSHHAGSESWGAEDADVLSGVLPGFGAVVFGPGLGRDKGAAAFTEALLHLPDRPPLVLDADALFALAGREDLLSLLRPCDVLTPHPGEAATLLGISAAAVQADRFAALRALAGLAPAVWVLKGEGTLIAAPGKPSVISPWRVPQLAVAGSGDVLAGIAGALLARGHAADLAATLGVWLHALAGMRLSREFPMRGNGPHDIADALPGVLASAGEPRKEDVCPSF